jgi:hypothetical protein
MDVIESKLQVREGETAAQFPYSYTFVEFYVKGMQIVHVF